MEEFDRQEENTTETQAAENPQEPQSEPYNNADALPINTGGGLFAEQSFAQPQQGYGQQYMPYNPAAQNVPPVYGYQQGQADNQYRQMYSAQPQCTAQQINGQQQYAPQQPNTVYNAVPPQYNYYRPAPADIPPVSDIPQTEMKKSSKAWIIAVIIVVLVLIGAVVLLLAQSHKNKGSIDAPSAPVSASGENVTVNINVAPKPVTDESLYQNKETGLFTTAGAAQQVLPSIVNLYGYTTTAIAAYNEASGVIISEDGYIITNAHAVENINRFKAKLYDGREFEADVIGVDTRTDLAVLKITADDLIPAVLGNSDELLQGEEIIAVGNAGGFNDTVTVGYVSYVNREIKSYTGYPIECIQTDAALNFGNSGGALVNLYGQVVGIVVSKYSSTGTENIGFGIATSFAVPIVEDLIENGFVTSRPRIGITYRLIDPETASSLEVQPGLLVAEISPDCDISNTQLRIDDIITELDGARILTDADVKNFQNTHSAGEKVKAKVYRKTITGEVTEFEIEFVLEQDKTAVTG